MSTTLHQIFGKLALMTAAQQALQLVIIMRQAGQKLLILC